MKSESEIINNYIHTLTSLEDFDACRYDDKNMTPRRIRFRIKRIKQDIEKRESMVKAINHSLKNLRNVLELTNDALLNKYVNGK